MSNRRGGNTYRNGGGGDDDDNNNEYDPYGDASSFPSRPADRFRRPGPPGANPAAAPGGRYVPRPPNSRNGSSGPPPGSSSPSRTAGRLAPVSAAGSSPRRSGRDNETDAERQISNVLDHIRQEWPSMLEDDCVPVVLGLQLLDSSSVGRAHDYRKFRHTHEFLQRSLKNIVHEHHQGFNSSIGTFHKIQGSIQASQKRVRTLKDSLAAARTSLCSTDPELKKLSAASQAYDEVLQVLNEVEELRIVPDQLEARISEKRFLTAVELLHNALRKMRRPELDEIGALAELRNYLANQETALQDILVEELHEHLYLKSPYCQERWQTLAKSRGSKYPDPADLVPFHQILDSIDVDKPAAEDPAKNPEGDTFYYIGLLVEALNRLGRLQNAVDTLKQRLPVELFAIVNETTTEVDNRHLKTLRNRSSPSLVRRETKLQAEVIYDLLWTLYAKFEAIAEGQRVFHESVKALIRREGAGNNSALLGSFKELWHLYQNEIRSLLHNYVTTDADVYHFARSPHHGGSSFGGGDYSREHLFKLSEVDAKDPEMMAEMDALEGIMRSAVPGLTSASSSAARKGSRHAGGNSSSQRKTPFADPGDHNQPSRKSLVEPSVFNMSLLLPPTLTFLQRLKTIVPPGSDLATSTLTTFLDNFLVNVFQPQLDETLGKLSDTIFGEPDSFLQDQDWRRVAKRPVLKGTTAFFDVVTAFCRMLGTIPHDQALSSLIITQMNRYYERCLGWYKSLASRATAESDVAQLRVSAQMALESGEMQDVMSQLWDEASSSSSSSDPSLLDKEVDMLIAFASSTKMGDGKSQDMDMVSSLCLLYTSLNWLRVKIAGLRHITHQEADSSRPMTPRAPSRRWTLMNDPGKLASDNQPVILPMTHETVQTFDTIVTSYKDLAVTALLTLHMEARCQIAYSLSVALSPETAPYLLDQEVSEPDPQILSLNSDLVAYDEIVSRFLPAPEVAFVRTGLGRLVNSFLVSNASRASPMNIRGCHRMHLNILVLQQNLKNIEDGVALTRAAEYYSLFEKGPDAIVEKAKAGGGGGGGGGGGEGDQGEVRFSYDELKALLDLFYSEPLANPERGIASAAKRQLDDKSLSLNEIMWS